MHVCYCLRCCLMTSSDGDPFDTSGVQRMNHAARAIPYLRALSALANRRSGFRRSAIGWNWVADLLERSQKFILPEGGRLLGVSASRLNVDLPLAMLRPPYPITCAEYRLSPDVDAGPDAFRSLRRIVIMLDLARVDLPSFIPPDVSASACDAGAGALGVISVFANDDRQHAVSDANVRSLSGVQDTWSVGPAMAIIRHNQCGRAVPATIGNVDPAFVHVATSVLGIPDSAIVPVNFLMGFVPLLPEIVSMIEERTVGGESDALAAISADVMDELRVAQDFCISINCQNVGEIAVPASPALNKKRVSSGKPPLFDYKVLKVNLGRGRNEGHDGESDASHRRSPRQHFRRGHVRRIGDDGGRIVWVSPAVIGNSADGVVEKDYMLLV